MDGLHKEYDDYNINEFNKKQAKDKAEIEKLKAELTPERLDQYRKEAEDL